MSKNAKEGFINGRSGYALYGDADGKKYCGNGTETQGVEVDGQVVLTASQECIRARTGACPEFHSHYIGEQCPVGEVIPESLHQSLNHFGEIQSGKPKYRYAK